MAAALAAPLVGLGFSATAASTIATAGLYIATTAASIFLQMAMMEKPEQDIGTKLDAVMGGAVNQSIHVGRKETAGSFIYKGSWGRSGRVPNAYLTKVFCLSDRPVEGFEDYVWADGIKCNYDPEETSIVDGNNIGHPIPKWDHSGGHRVWVKFHDGTQNTADSYLTDKFGTGPRAWTADHIGRGRAYMIVTQKYDKKEPTGEMEILPVIKNTELYDWRNDTTNGGSGSQRYDNYGTYGVDTGNPITTSYNVMRGLYYDGTWLYGGQKWPATRFDNDTWTAAANKCDTDVAGGGGGTLKYARIGAEIDVSEEPWSVVERLLKSCNGRIVESGGKFKVYVGGIGASVYSFTDDQVILSEELTGKLFPSRDQIANTVNGTYIEPENSGEAKAYKPRTKQEFIDEDGDVRKTTLDFEYVRDNRQAQRVARLALMDNRRFRTFSVAFWSHARKLEPCDVVSWTSERYQFTDKKFIIGDVVLRDDGIVVVNLREADASDADWNPLTDEDPFETGVFDDLDEPTQTFAATVTATAIKDDDGTTDKRPAIRIQATLDDDFVDCRALRYQVRKKNGDQKIIYRGRSQSFFEVDNDDYGDITFTNNSFIPGREVQVRYKIEPESDRETEWSDWTAHELTLTDTPEVNDDPPADLAFPPTMTLVTRVRKDGTVAQKLLVDIDLTGRDDKETYRIRVVDTTEDPDEATKYDTGEFPFAIPVQSLHSYTITVAPVSRYGVRGNFTTAATGVTMPIPKKASGDVPTPSGFTLDPGHKKNVLEWDPVDRDVYPDYAYTLIAKDNSNGFPSPLIKHKTGSTWTDGKLANKETKYYRIRHVDTSGNVGPWSGILNSTTTLIDDDDTDDSTLAAPTGLTLTKVQDTDEDGKVQTYVKMECTAPGWFTSKSTYEFEVTVGSDVFIRKSGDAKEKFQVQKTNVLHSVRVRAVKGNGNRGSWTSAVTITPSKKSTSPTTLSSLTTLAKPNSIRLYWNASLDADFKEVQVYRNTVNNSGTATFIGASDSSSFRDDAELVQGTTYYYWVRPANFSGVPGAFSTVASAVFRGVEDGDADETPLAAPTGLTLTKVQDTDEDGKVQTYVKMECTAPAGVTANTTYTFEITVGSDVYREKSEDVKKRFLVQKTNVLHSVRVRAVKGVGTKGTWSSAVTITPSKKTTAPADVTWESVNPIVQKPKSILLRTQKPADRDIEDTVFYRNTVNNSGTAVEIGASKGTRYKDEDELVRGTTYYYWAKHRTQSDVLSASFSAVQSIAYRGVTTDDVEDQAITVKKRREQGDRSNMVPDDEMFDPTVWASFGGAIIQGLNNTTGAVSKYAFSQAATAVDKHIFTNEALTPIAVKGGKQYFISGKSGPLTAVSCNHYMQAQWYSRDVSGNLVFISGTLVGSVVGSTVTEKSGVVTAPANASAMRLVFTLMGGATVGHWCADPVFRKATEEDLIADNAVSDRKRKRRDNENMVRNPDCDDLTLWTGTVGLTSIADGLGSESTNRLEIPASAALTLIQSYGDIPVREGKKYFVSVVHESPDNVAISCQLQINWYSDVPIGTGPGYIINTFIGSVNVSTSPVTQEAIVTAPAGARRAMFIGYKNAGTSSKYSISGPVFRRASDEDLIPDNAVGPKKRREGSDKSNMIPDDEMEEGSNLWGINASNVITRVVNTQTGAVSKYALTQAATTTLKSIYSNVTAKPISVKGGKKYYVSGVNGPLTAVSITHYVQIEWWRRDGSGNLVFISSTNVGVTTGSAITEKSAIVTAPANASAVQFTFHVAAGASVGHWASDPIFRKATEEDVMAVGRSNNLLINTNANLGLMFWKEWWDPNNNNVLKIGAVDYGWAPKGEQVFYIEQLDGVSTSYTDVVQADEFGDDRRIPVDPGQRYELHLLTGAHRCTASAWIFFYDNAGTGLAFNQTDANTGAFAGGPSLSTFQQIGVFAVAPATATYAKIVIRKQNTNSGQANSYLFFTHMFFAPCGVNQTEYSPWSENGNLVVTDDMTDNRVRAAPTGLALTKLQDTDEDGTVRTQILMECVAPTWATSKTDYEFEVTVTGDTSPEIVKSGDVDKKYRVRKTGVLHSVRVRAKMGTGQRSAWSSPLTLTPTKKASLPTAISTIIATSRPNGIRIQWTYPADLDYKRIEVYGNSVNDSSTAGLLGVAEGNEFKDDTARTQGATYYYWTKVINRSNIPSVFSPVASAVYRYVQEADTDTSALATPTSVSINTAAADVDDDGSQEPWLWVAWTAVAGVKFYSVRVTYASVVGGPYNLYQTYKVDGAEGFLRIKKPVSRYFYKATVKAHGWNGSQSSASGEVGPVSPPKRVYALGAITPTWSAYRRKHVIKVANAPITTAEFAYLEIRDKPANTLVYRGRNDEYTRMNPPAGVTGYRVRVYNNTINHASNNSGDYDTAGSTPSSGNDGVDDIVSNELSSGCVTSVKLADNAVTGAKLAKSIVVAEDKHEGASINPGDNILITLSITHGDADHVCVLGHFINNEGSQRTDVTVRLERDNGSTIAEAVVTLDDDGAYVIFGKIGQGALSGTGTSVVQLRASGSFQKRDRKIMAWSVW